MSQTKRRLALGLVTAGLAAGVGAAVAPALPLRAQEAEQRQSPAGDRTVTAPRTEAVADAQRLGEAVATVAESVSPAVVSIRVEAVQEQAQTPFGGNGFGLPFPFRFQLPDDGQPNVVRGGGSGVIIRSDGYVLTNNHVVQNARRIEVVLQDGRNLRGEVVGTDAATDLAVLKVEASGLPTARFARSDRARVGEWVVAIGSPFGLDYTVTTGVLSGKGRGGLGMNEIEDYLQTDASINPGNSGGPLVNLRGEVLGINTMIVGRGTGIGFAVPSDIASSVSRQLIEDGRVQRAWLGVGFQELTPELASQFGTSHRNGALISNVVPDGPGARAGVRAGDIVVSIAGEPVREGRDLLRLVLRQRVGARVPVEVLRNGNTRTLNVVLTERPGEETQEEQGGSSSSGRGQQQRHDGYGLDLRPMTSQIKQQLRYSGNGAVVVAGVANGSAAERAGLRRGDVIIEADRRAVQSTDQVAQALNDGTALLRVERGDNAFFTVLSRE